MTGIKPPVYHRIYWIGATLLFLTVLAVFAVRTTTPVKDGDIWFHLLYGKYFIENHTLIPDHTIFSWTPSSNDTIYCTWAGSSLIYLIYKFSGLSGLFIFRYLCMSVIICGCLFYARKLKLLGNPITWLVCLNAVIMSNAASFLKPEILSFVLMSLSVWNWYHIRSSGESAWRNVYLFPMFMLIWVNTHGGFVFGAVFYFLAGLGELLNTWFAPYNMLPQKIRKHLLIAFPLAALAIFCTPYGFHYPLRLAVDLLPSKENLDFINTISAYHPTFITDYDSFNFVLAANLSIVIFLLLAACRFRRLEWSTLLANLVFAWLYTRFIRTTYFWSPIVLFSFLYLLTPGQSTDRPDRPKRKLVFLVFPLLITLIGLGVGGYTIYKDKRHGGRFWQLGPGYGSPYEETAYIEKYFPHVRIGNTYNQGAYLLWKIWPENKIFIDARQFPYRDWYGEYHKFAKGGAKEMTAMNKKYPVDLWLVGHHSKRLQFSLLTSEKWKLAFYGDNSAVIVRADLQLPENNKQVGDRIFNLPNPVMAKKIIRFAVGIGDYDTARKIVSSLEDKGFHTKTAKTVIQNYHDYIAGIKAYMSRDYETAISKFRLLPIDQFAIRLAYTNCFQYLTRKHWQRDELEEAALNASRALFLVTKDNPYAMYNRGIIGWYMKQHPELLKDKKEKKKKEKIMPYSFYLQEFIREFAKIKRFAFQVKTARAILQNEFNNDKPELLLPEEPEYTKLFIPPDKRKQDITSVTKNSPD